MDTKIIKEIVDIMNQGGLSRMSVEFAGLKLELEAGGRPATAAVQTLTALEVQTATITEAAPAPTPPANVKSITAPIVGIFHSLKSMNKGDITVGSKISSGDVVCSIEAMKLINDVMSDISGEVVEVLVKDGDMVEFGQTLITVK